MTVAELMAALKEFDGDMPVTILQLHTGDESEPLTVEEWMDSAAEGGAKGVNIFARLIEKQKQRDTLDITSDF
jgi:hypothetical protein